MTLPPALFGELPSSQKIMRSSVLQTSWDSAQQASSQSLKRTCWKYADFMHLYRGASLPELYAVFTGRVDSDQMDQCVIDLQEEIRKEAKERGMKEREITLELESRARAAGLPSSTGKTPSFGASAAPDDLLLALGLWILGLSR